MSKPKDHKGVSRPPEPSREPRAVPARTTTPRRPPPVPPPEQRGTGTHAATRATLQALDGLDVDTLVVLVTQDQRPLQGAAGLLDWRLCGYLSGLLVEHAATGRVGEYVLTHPFGRVPVTRVLLVGVGPQDTVNTSLKTVLPELARVVTEAGCRKVALATGCPVAVAMEALALSPVALRERVRVLFDETAA